MSVAVGADETVELSTRLFVTDLLQPFSGLSGLLAAELSSGSSVNAFLLAAGMHQVAEDYLDHETFPLGKLEAYLGRLPSGVRSAASRGAGVAGHVLRAFHRAQSGTRRVSRWLPGLQGVVCELAASVAAEQALEAGVTGHALRMLSDLEAPLALGGSVIRLPSCFRSFDQRPDDLGRISEEFARRWPERDRPLVVVGIRTSGSYLAPLYRAFLRQCGYASVEIVTLRPDVPLRADVARLVRQVAAAGGLALVCDDPPSTGSSIARAGRMLEGCGFRRESVVLLLQLFDSEARLPAALTAYSAVLLPWRDWAVHRSLTPAAVATSLRALLPQYERVEIRQLSGPALGRHRGHVRALYRATFAGSSGRRAAVIQANGVGLGYLGEHGSLIADSLGDWVPRVYGVSHGVLFREHLPDSDRLTVFDQRFAESAARYVHERARRLAIPTDTSQLLLGRDAVWQRGADLLGRGFGRAWPIARTPLHAAARRLLKARHPAVIDGRMEGHRWFTSGARVVKADFDEGAFSNQDFHSYDPVFDLAGAAAGLSAEVQDAMCRAYERLDGEDVDPERWWLYTALHLDSEARDPRGALAAVERDLARSAQLYFERTLFKETARTVSGPFCALDVDGVLETYWLGFPSITPLGALALHALARHGRRVVLVTGRSFHDVQARCRSYRATAGVAEYGSVAYDAVSGRHIELLPEDALEDVHRLRRRVSGMAGACIDGDYERSVRAYLVRDGRRKHLPEDLVAAALEGFEGRIRAIPGGGQTDFVSVHADKGRGLGAVMAALGAASDERPELAIGDTEPDLPMLELAVQAFAPANAADALRSHPKVRVMRSTYQRGVAEAVRSVLGHPPGHCARCRPPALPAASRLLLTMLAAQDERRLGKPLAALRLALATVRP